MVAMSIAGLLGMGLFGNIMMHGRSFRYNQTSNQNVHQAGMALQRVIYGTPNYWGMRMASRSGMQVVPTGVVGDNGALGWQVVYRHNLLVTDDMPESFSQHQQTLVFDPRAQTLTLNDHEVARNVVDAYFEYNGRVAGMGLQIEHETYGLQAMVETRCTLRNQ